MLLDHEFFMKEALKEASFAFDKGEIPVGAVVVSQNKIIESQVAFGVEFYFSQELRSKRPNHLHTKFQSRGISNF